jgi:hypothetical protein
MDTPEQKPEPTFANISDLLFFVAKRDKELEAEGRKKLHHQHDNKGWQELVRQRAQLLADLPETLAEYKAKGGDVPKEAEDFAGGYSVLAKEMLAEDNMFGMDSLLSAPGLMNDDPNDLERLAARLQPPDEV